MDDVLTPEADVVVPVLDRSLPFADPVDEVPRARTGLPSAWQPYVDDVAIGADHPGPVTRRLMRAVDLVCARRAQLDRQDFSEPGLA